MHYNHLLREHPRISFIGQATRRMEHARRLADQGQPVPFFSDWRDMIQSRRPDIALIALPSSEVFQIAEQLLNKPLSVLVDGTPGGKAKPVKRLISLANEQGQRIGFCHPKRHQGAVNVIRAVLEKQALGPLHSVGMTLLSPSPCPEGRETRTRFGEWLYDPFSLLHTWFPDTPSNHHHLARLDETTKTFRLLVQLSLGKLPVSLSVLNEENLPSQTRWELRGQRGTLLWLQEPKEESLRVLRPGEKPRDLPIPQNDPYGDALHQALFSDETGMKANHHVTLQAVGDIERCWKERQARERQARKFADQLRSTSWEELCQDWQAMQRYDIAELLPSLLVELENAPDDPSVQQWLNLLKRIAEHEPLTRNHADDALAFVQSAKTSDCDDETAWALGQDRSFTQKTFVLRLDNRCNEACLFCNVKTEAHAKLNHDTEQARQAILRQAKGGAKSLVLTGGEPTLRNDLPDLVAFAHSLGLNVELQTNALLLEDLSFALRLSDAGLSGALVSLHSHTEQVSDHLTQRQGAYSRTLTGIDNLLRTGVRVRLSHVLTTHNAQDVADFIGWLARRFPAIHDVDVMINQHMGEGKKHPELLPRFSDIAPGLTQAQALAARHGIRLNNALTFPPCLFGDKPEETLEAKRMRAFERHGKEPDAHTLMVAREKVKAPVCHKCRYDRYCFGVWKGYAEVHGLDELKPIPADPTRSAVEKTS